MGTPQQHNTLTSIPISHLINTAPTLQQLPVQTNWQNLISSPTTLACVRAGLPSGSIVLQPQYATNLPGVTLGNNHILNSLSFLQAGGSNHLNTIAGLTIGAGGRVSTIPQVLSLAQIPNTLGSNKDINSSLPMISIRIPTSSSI